ncbi:uncharacterized protein M421DRAFT_415608 [Didymella exigua CBS 183.55]|uniref:Uncharacterized protein n=1 Tax=Didymella exigua CBS 183.55 TaxID=1150837 RepID=A0A6A5RZH3_9PLEO|nr:uncharacterized protein M421DRAFT_415608 [Didymella exigua CBS 183.55]KAF1933262.1 hypothetical protein M421DRAFT_415608 [Didymella exigua CBS 183.55]
MRLTLLLASILCATSTYAQNPVYRTNLNLNHSRLTIEYGGAIFDNTTLGIVQPIRNVSTPPTIKTRTWLLDSNLQPIPAMIIMMGHHIQSGSRPLYLRWLVTNVTLAGNLSNTLADRGVLTSTDSLNLTIPFQAEVPYMNPLIRCQQNDSVWCGQNHIITIYPQVKGFDGTAGYVGGNESRTQGDYDVAQLQLAPGYFENIAANNRSGFNITQFQLDIGLAQAEDGKVLSETSPIGAVQMSTFGPDGGVDQLSAASFPTRSTVLFPIVAAVFSTLVSSIANAQ